MLPDPLSARIQGYLRYSCEAMKNPEPHHHLCVNWVGQSSTQSITLYGVEVKDTGTGGQTLCPGCAQVAAALNACGLGPESLRELFATLWVIGPSEMKAKMEALRRLGVQMDVQGQAQLN